MYKSSPSLWFVYLGAAPIPYVGVLTRIEWFFFYKCELNELFTGATGA